MGSINHTLILVEDFRSHASSYLSTSQPGGLGSDVAVGFEVFEAAEVPQALGFRERLPRVFNSPN